MPHLRISATMIDALIVALIKQRECSAGSKCDKCGAKAGRRELDARGKNGRIKVLVH